MKHTYSKCPRPQYCPWLFSPPHAANTDTSSHSPLFQSSIAKSYALTYMWHQRHGGQLMAINCLHANQREALQHGMATMRLQAQPSAGRSTTNLSSS